MNEYQTLSHTKWEGKYHVVFGCITKSWHSSGELGARLPVALPGLFEKDTAQGKQGIEVSDIPAHPRSFDACRRELFASALHRARSDNVAPLAIGAIALSVPCSVESSAQWRQGQERCPRSARCEPSPPQLCPPVKTALAL